MNILNFASMLLLALLPGIAAASEDCMMVDFPDHVELVCSGDGVRIPESDQKLLQNRMPISSSASQTNQASPVEANTPVAANVAEPVKPEEMVIVPKTLQIRMDRAAKTMERMRLQKMQRDTDPTLPHITAAP